jgi:hypothetical protein
MYTSSFSYGESRLMRQLNRSILAQETIGCSEEPRSYRLDVFDESRETNGFYLFVGCHTRW